MKMTKLPVDLMSEIIINSGIIVSEFYVGMSIDAIIAAIIGATTSDITFEAAPETSDFGEDINNCPVNVKELKILEYWTATLSGSYVSVNTDQVVSLLGAADIDTSDTTHIVPRNDLDPDNDFKDIWLLADYSRKNGDNNGGYIAIHMMNALSTDGFKLKTTNRGKGTMDFTYTAHYSIEDQETVPFEIYLVSGTDETATASLKPGTDEAEDNAA